MTASPAAGRESTASMAVGPATLVVAFARACKSAARAVVLYPPDHPAVGTVLEALAKAAQAAAAAGPLVVSVTPGGLLVDGLTLPKPDQAASELAMERLADPQLKIEALKAMDARVTTQMAEALQALGPNVALRSGQRSRCAQAGRANRSPYGGNSPSRRKRS